MPVTPADIKKALVAAGFELYRTRGNEVQIADRVRDNFSCAMVLARPYRQGVICSRAVSLSIHPTMRPNLA